jgi:halimadienyl-diphosphate synthase
LAYLFAIRRNGAYWRDKWHASVYYPTTRALAILSPYERSRLEPTVEWLLANQRPDGSWGEHMATTEETSLVLLSLLQYHRTARPVPEEPMRRAAAYLSAGDGSTDLGFPELWIGKSLYAPVFIIEATRLSALTLYKDTFGGA